MATTKGTKKTPNKEDSIPSTKEILDAVIKLREASGENPRYPELDMDDFNLEYSIKGFSKNGKEFEVKGNVSMPQVLAEDMRLESKADFQAIFTTSIFRPAITAFNRVVDRAVSMPSKL